MFSKLVSYLGRSSVLPQLISYYASSQPLRAISLFDELAQTQPQNVSAHAFDSVLRAAVTLYKSRTQTTKLLRAI